MKYITEWRNVYANKLRIFSKLKAGIKIVVFDVETTGTSVNSKIIQFSAARYRLDEELKLHKENELSLFINPEETISERVTKINRITNDMVKSSPVEGVAAPKIFSYLENCDLLCGYNVAFDVRMVMNMAERVDFIYSPKPYIDVIEMARDFTPIKGVEDYTLSSIFKYHNPDLNLEFHDSDEDVKATAILLEKFFDMYYRYQVDTDKKPIHLERGAVFINPRKPSQQRIVVKINEGNVGDIYFDIVTKKWRCKTSTEAKRLFSSIDLIDLERQFIEKYGKPYGNYTMEGISKTWLEYKRKR